MLHDEHRSRPVTRYFSIRATGPAITPSGHLDGYAGILYAMPMQASTGSTRQLIVRYGSRRPPCSLHGRRKFFVFADIAARHAERYLSSRPWRSTRSSASTRSSMSRARSTTYPVTSASRFAASHCAARPRILRPECGKPRGVGALGRTSWLFAGSRR
jgi:hypothetical protein